jgi:hypothetical protein
MSCSLLEKLAPETRTLIYEYVLTFDAPLKHAYNMRPFLEKSGKSTESNESKTEEVLSEEPSAASNYFNRVNTSILTTSKLVYNEAIPVFYKQNTITIDAAVCRPENITELRATDLSLATQVTLDSVPRVNPQDGRTDGLGQEARFAKYSFSKIFPKLKTAVVHIYTDAHATPVSTLFAITASLRSSRGYATVRFNGVGSVVALPICPRNQPQFALVIQCRRTVDRWAKGKVDLRLGDKMGMSMRAVYETWRRTGNVPGTIDPVTHRLFNAKKNSLVPVGYPPIVAGSYEFWTIADESLRQMQLQWQHRERIMRLATSGLLPPSYRG